MRRKSRRRDRTLLLTFSTLDQYLLEHLCRDVDITRLSNTSRNNTNGVVL